MKGSRRIILVLLTALSVVVVMEGISFVGGLYLQSQGVFYKARPDADYQTYLAQRDPLLGWPSLLSVTQGGERDESGSRVTPAYPDLATSPNCVALYGDSFTWSDEVDAESAWGNRLSQLLGCRVANYGVGGYGSDQAYLRYRKAENERAPVVVLNHLAENILRNLNRYRQLLYPGNPLGFKPRFLLTEEGGVELLPMPEIADGHYPQLAQKPERFFDHDLFLPGEEWGALRLEFPYSLSLLQALGHFHVRAVLLGYPWYRDFYSKEHVGQGVELTLRIMEAFVETARQRGQVPVVSVIASGNDLQYYQRHGAWVYEPLLQQLRQRGVPVVDFGAEMMKRLQGRDPCELFNNCSAHFSAAGYRMMAEIMAEYLQGEGVVAQ